VVRSISQVKAGDQLRGQLVDGELVLAVTGSSDKKL
jgi:exonuclease VII large subunit